jgi:ribosomal protein S18 acetylase RimI-like enzyme
MLYLKKAEPQDYSFIAQVYRSVAPVYDPIMPGFSESCAQAIENPVEPLTDYDISIIYLNETAIGFSSLISLNEEITYMLAFYFLPEYHNQGYGTKALELIFKSLKEKNIIQMILLAHKLANWAINFYLKNGFKIITDKESIIKNYANKTMSNHYVSDTFLMSKFVK